VGVAVGAGVDVGATATRWLTLLLGAGLTVGSRLGATATRRGFAVGAGVGGGVGAGVAVGVGVATGVATVTRAIAPALCTRRAKSARPTFRRVVKMDADKDCIFLLVLRCDAIVEWDKHI